MSDKCPHCVDKEGNAIEMTVKKGNNRWLVCPKCKIRHSFNR